MNLHVVFLQPRGGQPSWPATEDAGSAAQVSAPTVNVTTTVSGTPGSEINQVLCEDANRNMLVTAGGYDFAATLTGVVLFLLMRKKLWSTVFGRYLTAVLLAGTAAALLVGFDPVRADDLVRCLNSADYARYVWLSGSQVARALVLGLVPSFLLTLVGCFVSNRT